MTFFLGIISQYSYKLNVSPSLGHVILPPNLASTNLKILHPCIMILFEVYELYKMCLLILIITSFNFIVLLFHSWKTTSVCPRCRVPVLCCSKEAARICNDNDVFYINQINQNIFVVRNLAIWALLKVHCSHDRR